MTSNSSRCIGHAESFLYDPHVPNWHAECLSP